MMFAVVLKNIDTFNQIREIKLMALFPVIFSNIVDAGKTGRSLKQI